MRVLCVAVATTALLTGIVRADDIGAGSPPPTQPGNGVNPILAGDGIQAVEGDDSSSSASGAGGEAALLQRVREDSFNNIDKSLGINSNQLLADRVAQLGGTVSTDPVASRDIVAPAGNRSRAGGLIKRILNSDQADNILSLVATGVNKQVLIPVILGLLRDVAGQESGSLDGSQISEADLKYLENEANQDSVLKALREVQTKDAEIDHLQQQAKERQEELSRKRDAEVAKLDQKLAQDAETKAQQRDKAAKEKELKASAKLKELEEKLRRNEADRKKLIKEMSAAKQEPQ